MKYESQIRLKDVCNFFFKNSMTEIQFLKLSIAFEQLALFGVAVTMQEQRAADLLFHVYRFRQIRFAL